MTVKLTFTRVLSTRNPWSSRVNCHLAIVLDFFSRNDSSLSPGSRLTYKTKCFHQFLQRNWSDKIVNRNRNQIAIVTYSKIEQILQSGCLSSSFSTVYLVTRRKDQEIINVWLQILYMTLFARVCYFYLNFITKYVKDISAAVNCQTIINVT